VAAVAELERLLVLLPGPLRQTLDDHPQRGELLELVLDLGRVPFARFPNGEEAPLSAEVLTRSQLEQAVCACGEFGADNRAGVDRTLHRVSCIRNRAGLIVGLTARVGRSIAGSAELIRDIATEGQSILLLGRPGVGKTTAIRELARILADDVRRRVVIVDSSNEIGGDGDVPHPGVGGARRMMMYVPDAQHQVLIEAVENHVRYSTQAFVARPLTRRPAADAGGDYSRRDWDRVGGDGSADHCATWRAADCHSARPHAAELGEEPFSGGSGGRRGERDAWR